MSMRLQVGSSFKLAGKNFREQQTIECDGALVKEASQGVALSGNLTSLGNATTGNATYTFDGNHTIGNGSRIDQFFEDGSYRYGATVNAVGATTIGVTGGTGGGPGNGGVLPAQGTRVTISVPSEESLSFDGDDCAALAMDAPAGAECLYVLGNTANGAQLVVHLNPNTSYTWHEEKTDTNPVEGLSIAKVFMSHGNLTNAKDMKVGVGLH